MPCTIQSTFIGNFKLGDNINFNLDLLAMLYENYSTADAATRRLLRKPIIITSVSIIEAVLHDLHDRIRTFTSEGVANVAFSISQYVRGKRLDELEKLIVSARKHDFFDQRDTDFYDRLDELRRLRNRIHIQNTKKDFEADEANAFSEARMRLAERALEKTLRTMLAKFDRGQQFGYVRDFELPWNPHYC